MNETRAGLREQPDTVAPETPPEDSSESRAEPEAPEGSGPLVWMQRVPERTIFSLAWILNEQLAFEDAEQCADELAGLRADPANMERAMREAARE